MKKRKSSRAKRVSSGCRNNGTCKVCESDRTHANKRAEPADLDEQMRAGIEEVLAEARLQIAELSETVKKIFERNHRSRVRADSEGDR